MISVKKLKDDMANNICVLILISTITALLEHCLCGQMAKVICGKQVTNATNILYGISLLQCERTCSNGRRQGTCNIYGYDTISRTCYHSLDHADGIINTNDVTKNVIIPNQIPCQSGEYLVNGVNPVLDSQLTASSVFKNEYTFHGTWAARLHTMPSLTTVGSWSAKVNNASQFIQVQFNSLVKVAGIALQGRPNNTDPNIPFLNCCNQYVTSYKFMYSQNCANFTTFPSANGSDMVFPANTDQDTVVTTMLPHQVTAKCVRINPQTWFTHISLRLDILGCY